MGSSLSHSGLRVDTPAELAGWGQKGASYNRNRTIVQLTFSASHRGNAVDYCAVYGPKKKRKRKADEAPVDILFGSLMIGAVRHYQLNGSKVTKKR